MDEVNSDFGNLSMGAAEWKPIPHNQRQEQQQQHQTSQHEQQQLHRNRTLDNNDSGSDLNLNPEAVKEFIPGQGWSASASTAHANQMPNDRATSSTLGTGSTSSRYNNQYEPSTSSSLPSGPSAAPPPSSFRNLHSLALSDNLYRYHRDLALESIRQMDPDDPHHKAVPLPYCNAYCLDHATNSQQQQQQRRISTRSSTFGYPSSTFQVTNRDDGYLYCLKRFDNVRSVSPKIAAAVSDRWNAAVEVSHHPSVVPLYQCFTAQRAVFFVHEYIPGARSLAERLSQQSQQGGGGALYSEHVLWSCIAQLVSAIRTIHAHNLAVRSLRLQHILSNNFPTTDDDTDSNQDGFSGRLRIRLNSLGVVDALEFESRKHVVDLQVEDIRDLGRLIVSMATGTDLFALSAERNGNNNDASIMSRCEQFMAQRFSRELHNLAMTLVMSQKPPSIQEIGRAIAASRPFEEQDATYRSLDHGERALAAEYESGRSLRLLLKLGFVNERPELGPNRRWSQSGDCYILTLFRDYVFHQADGAGYPVMDLGHVVTALNKLDAADEEKIVLSSRDGKSMMVVSFADVSRCLENAFLELCSSSAPSSSLQY